MRRHPLTAAIVQALHRSSEPPLWLWDASGPRAPEPLRADQIPVLLWVTNFPPPTWIGVDLASEPDATFFESISIQNEVPRCPGCGVRSDIYGCWCNETNIAAELHTPPALTLKDLEDMAWSIGVRAARRRWWDL